MNFLEYRTSGVGVDASDPNTTHPEKGSAALRARVIAITKFAVQGEERGDPKIAFFAIDGTTMSYIPWLLMEDQGLWVPLSAAQAATPTAPSFLTVPRLAGSSVYMQNTVVTGVTKYGWFYG